MQLKGRRMHRQEARAAMAAGDAPSRPASTTTIKQLTVDTPSIWTFDKVKAALDRHEDGDFSESALLVDAMGRDDRIDACLNTRVNAIASKNGLDFSIVPPDKGPQQLADLVSEWWYEAVTDATLKALTQDMVMMGVAIGRKHWVLRERKWTLSHIEHWHLSNVRWDNDRRTFVTQAGDREEVIAQGDSNWLVITPGGDRSWMCGAVRALGLPFVMRQWNWRDWSKYNERHGIPIIAIKEPSGFDKTSKDAFYRSLRNLGSKGILRLPQDETGAGFEADFLEPKDNSHKSFSTFRADLDVGIAVYLLGQNLTTEVQGGSYAAATVHGRVRNDYLCADAEGLSTPLRDQVVKPWCLFNLPSFDPALCPWPQWDTSLPEDLAGDAATLKAFGEAVTALETSGMPVDGDELAARFKVPLRKGEKYEAPEPAVVEPGQLDPGDDPDEKPAKKAAARARAATMAAKASGFVEGQIYNDDVIDDARNKAGKALQSGFLDDLLAVVKASGDDYDLLRRNVLAKWRERESPTELRNILQKAMVLSDLAGRAAVEQDA